MADEKEKTTEQQMADEVRGKVQELNLSIEKARSQGLRVVLNQSRSESTCDIIEKINVFKYTEF